MPGTDAQAATFITRWGKGGAVTGFIDRNQRDGSDTQTRLLAHTATGVPPR